MSLMVVAPHPDDETLGCGGTLLKAAASGREIDWVIATSVGSPNWSASEVFQKEAEIARVSSHYGFRHVIRLGFPSMALDLVPELELIAALRDATSRCHPRTVLLPGRHDVHGDHRRIAECAASVLKPQYLRTFGASEVLSYETASSTDSSAVAGDRASRYVDISDHFEGKIAAMRHYQSESQTEPMPRAETSIRASARYVGSIIGVEYAERFAVLWQLA